MKAIHLKETDLVALILPTDLKSYKLTDNGTILMWQLNDGKEYFADLMREHLEIGTCSKDHIDFDVEPITNATGLQGKEIFLQMLKANGILFENPYGEEPKEIDFRSTYDCALHRYNWQEPHDEAKNKWQQAESQLTPKVLILKKLK